MVQSHRSAINKKGAACRGSFLIVFGNFYSSMSRRVRRLREYKPVKNTALAKPSTTSKGITLAAP